MQLSISRLYKANAFEKTHFFVSPQLRYYFKADSRYKSFYAGGLVQYYKLTSSAMPTGEYSLPETLETVDFKKMGLGVLGGFQYPIYKRLGVDAHIGGAAYAGNEQHTIHFFNSNSSTSFKENKLRFRPFYTFNIYIILGKIYN